MRLHSRSVHVDARVWNAWDAQIAAAHETPGLPPTLLQQRNELLPRFADHYQRLRALPRRARRILERRWRRTLAGVAMLLALGIAVPAEAVDIRVDGTTCTLADAIRAANTDTITGGCRAGSGADTIVLPDGSIQALATALPDVTTMITIDGHGSTIKRSSGAPQFLILSVREPGNLTLRDTIVTGGQSIDGGGIANYFGAVTVIDSTISGNSADQGGGVNNFGGALSLTNSTVSGNSARRGDGGGIYNAFGNVFITNSTISGNSATSDGGGIYTFRGYVHVANSTISGNVSTTGNGGGGGVYSFGGIVTLTDSTISGNAAPSGGGGGLFNFSYGSMTLVRTLVSGNSARTTKEIHNATTASLYADNFNLFGHSGAAGVVGFTPGATDLVPGGSISSILNPTLADNGGPTRTHALVSGSPAVDAVTGEGCPAQDQRGVARPVDGDGTGGPRCDIGAFELTSSSPPPPSSSLDQFLCYTIKSRLGNTCAAGSPNEGAACTTEDDCGGTNGVTAFCASNKFPTGVQVTLSDQFQTNLVDVQRPVSLCNPADTDGEDPGAVTDPEHLAAYQIKETAGQPKHVRRRGLTVTNRFGTLHLDTIAPSRLLVPTAKSHTGPVPAPVPTIDHFECYTVRISAGTPAFPKGVQATVVDQFNQPTRYDVVKPTRLCTPVDKNGESPGAADHPDHLACYGVNPAIGQPRHRRVLDLHVNNPFGPERVDTITDDELCVPSSRPTAGG